MRKVQINIGQRFGRLVVVKNNLPSIKKNISKRVVFCRCDCGSEKNVFVTYLINGETKSCGCLKREIRSQKRVSIYRKDSPTYTSWTSMKARCKRHPDYAGKGIGYDPSWEKFDNFLADMGDRPDGTSLDRIDNSKGYCKSNCRWSDKKAQTRNRTNTKSLTIKGVTKTIGEWANEFEIDYRYFHRWIKNGSDIETMISKARK